MAAISSISNGEALSSVRTKLNSVITEINLLDPTDWVDYSATSTVVGWSSFTTKQIRYRVIGKQVFVHYNLSGVSNSTSTTFTLPNNSLYTERVFGASTDNGTLIGAGIIVISANSNSIILGANQTAAGNWTSSGTKTTIGQFFYEIA